MQCNVTFEVTFDASSSSRSLRFLFLFLFGSSKRKQNCFTFTIHSTSFSVFKYYIRHFLQASKKLIIFNFCNVSRVTYSDHECKEHEVFALRCISETRAYVYYSNLIYDSIQIFMSSKYLSDP